MNVYLLSSFVFMMLAYMALLKASVVAGYFELYQMDFLIEFSIFLLVFEASLITYYLQYLLYAVVIARSPTTRFICAVVLSLIKAYVYPKLYGMTYEILLAYAFQETSMILQYVFYASYRMEARNERERFFVVKLVIIRSITFAFNDLISANYLAAATMSIPVMVGLLVLLDYNEALSTLREWFYGHRNDLMNNFVETIVEDRNWTTWGDGNGLVV